MLIKFSLQLGLLKENINKVNLEERILFRLFFQLLNFSY
jgi:hypothetical protein